MLLVKLNDKLMFNGDKNKSHLYLVYKNKNKVKYLRQLTHLYIKDDVNVNSKMSKNAN